MALGTTKLVGLGIVLLLLGLVGCAITATPIPGVPTEPTQTSTIAPTPTLQLSEIPFEQLKEMAGQVSYDDLFRNNEDFLGELVYYRAQVIQVIEASKDRFQLRANVTQGEYSWDDTVFLRYSGPRLLEDDIIEFVGEVNELATYESIFGQQITIPDITIMQSQLVAKASDPTPAPLASPTPTPAPTVPGTPTPTLAPTPTPEPISLAGVGQQASSTFNLNQGLAIFSMTHDGQSNFAITLLDSQGNLIDLLVNEIGAFDGSKAVGIEQTGAYILDISADKNWDIVITQPAPLSEIAPPFTLSGGGQQASQLFNLESGLTTFKMTHDGQSNFAALLLDSEGNLVELVVNEIGAFDGSTAVGVREPGVYILDVTADGNWTVNIEQ